MPNSDLHALPPPRRPPIGKRRYRFAGMQLAAAMTWLAMSATISLGPLQWRSSPSYQVIAAILPLRYWAVIFAFIGVAQLATSLRRRPSRRGLMFGAAVAAAWATSLVASALVGRLAGFASPVLWTFLAAAQVIEANEQHHRRR